MADPTFDIFFEGKLAVGAEPGQVRENLARLFKTEPAKLGHLFAGQRVAIKKGVDQATAANYRAAMAKAGALVDVVPAGAAAAPAPARTAPPAAAPAPRTQDTNTGAVPGSAAAHGSPLAAALAAAPAAPPAAAPAKTPPPPAPPPPSATPIAAPAQVPDFTVAEVGALLVEPQAFRPAEIATDHLSVAEVGAILSDATPPPEPQFDLSALNLAPVGTPLSEDRPVPEPQFDLSGLKLAE